MRTILYYILAIAIMMLCPLLTAEIIAQPPPPQAQPIPIDGGSLFLLIAGIGYGIKKMFENKKK